MDLERLRICECTVSPSLMLMDRWRRFRGDEYLAALEDARRTYPKANAVRVMHSYDAYLRDPRGYLDLWEEVLALCDGAGFSVVACLFNRFHDVRMDCGGVYLESLIPGISWAYREGFYAPFLSDVCARRASDGRIALWETCNKPFGAYSDFSGELCENWRYELRWLREIYCYVKQTGASAPAAVSLREWYGEGILAALEDCCDAMLLSPYNMNPGLTLALAGKAFPTTEKPILSFEELMCVPDPNNIR